MRVCIISRNIVPYFQRFLHPRFGGTLDALERAHADTCYQRNAFGRLAGSYLGLFEKLFVWRRQ